MDGAVCLADFLRRLFYKDVDSEKRDIRTRQNRPAEGENAASCENADVCGDTGRCGRAIAFPLPGMEPHAENCAVYRLFRGLGGGCRFPEAVLCMKDSRCAGISEKDKTVLVTNGLYAFSRNPAFLGFDLMYLGIFLLYGNVLNGLCTVFAVVMLHLQILQEKKYMTDIFWQAYCEYYGI